MINNFPLPIANISFITMSLLFIVFIDPLTMDPDSALGISQFKEVFGENIIVESLGVNDSTIFLQFLMLFFSLFLINFLYFNKLISKEVLIFFLLLPYASYLVIKIKMEFFVAILALIKLELSLSKHIILLVILSIILIITGENNLVILIVFRLAYIAMKTFGIKMIFILIISISILVNLSFEILADQFSFIYRFYWTRDIINPEFSLIETIAVFIASFHLSFDIVNDWRFHMVFSFPFFIYLFVKGVKNYKNLDYKTLFSFVSIYYFFTSLTHAFQNARYYFFYLHLFQYLIKSKNEIIFYWLWGWIHAVSMILIKNYLI